MGGACNKGTVQEEYEPPVLSNGRQVRRMSVFADETQEAITESVAADVIRELKEQAAQGNIPFGTIGVESIAGVYPLNPAWISQDTVSVITPYGGIHGAAFMGVFDGHGRHGRHASDYARTSIPELVLKLGFAQDPRVALQQAMAASNENLEAIDEDDHFRMSGTTAVTIILVGRQIFVGNLGDSRAVMARFTKSEQLLAIPMSNDHKPDNPAEAARIKKMGGRIFPVDINMDPTPRVWLPDEDIPGVAFTRSVGDFEAQRVGVFGDPEMAFFQLTTADRFFILASDGIWEFMTNQEVVNFINKHNDPQEAATELCLEAKKRWLENEERSDDISCIIVRLNHEEE